MTESLTKKDLAKDPSLMVPICYDEVFKEVLEMKIIRILRPILSVSYLIYPILTLKEK